MSSSFSSSLASPFCVACITVFPLNYRYTIWEQCMNFIKHLLYWKMPENAEEKDGHRTEGPSAIQSDWSRAIQARVDGWTGWSQWSLQPLWFFDSKIGWNQSFKNISRETHTYLWKCLSKLSLVYVWEEMRCGHLVWEEEENGTYGLEERLLLCVRWWAWRLCLTASWEHVARRPASMCGNKEGWKGSGDWPRCCGRAFLPFAPTLSVAGAPSSTMRPFASCSEKHILFNTSIFTASFRRPRGSAFILPLQR